MPIAVDKIASRMTVAMFVAATVIGCSPVYVDWDHHSLRTKPEVHTSAAVSTPRTDTAYASHKTPSHPRKHKQTTNSTEEPQAPETPDVDQMSIQPGSAASSDSSGSTISMVSPGDTSAAAEKSLDTTSQRLGRFQRNRLNGSALASYDQANAFLNQGKQALAEKDYVAASGFAQKASVLADKLQTNPAGH